MSTKTKVLLLLLYWHFCYILVVGNAQVTLQADTELLHATPANATATYTNVSATKLLEVMDAAVGDTEVVEAAITLPTPTASTRRQRRQLFYDPSLLLLTNYGAEGSKCITSRGLAGVCVRPSGCQQFYRYKRQLSFLTLHQPWTQPAVSPALSLETCNFYDQFGRANSGICCTNTFLGNGFGVLPPFLIPGAVSPLPSPPTAQPPEVVPPTPDAADDTQSNENEEDAEEEDDVEQVDGDTQVTEAADALSPSDSGAHSPEFQDENNVIYDPIKDDADEFALRRTTPIGATTFNEFTYQWPGQFGSPFAGVWPPPLPTHPPSTAVWPPPIPTHPPNHHYPTHPPTAQMTTRRTTTTRATTRRPHVTTTTTRRPLTTTRPRPVPTTTTTRRPSYPSYPGFPGFPSYPGYPTYRPTYTTTTTTTTTRRPPAATSPAGSTPVGLPAQCGVKNAVSPDQERIVGGTNASPHEFPWIAVLFKAGKQFCGGSLITTQHILTAAHCVARMTSWDVAALTAHLGDYNIRTDFEVQHVVRRIKRLVRHKGFDFSTLHNDIAILTVSEPLKFTYEIQPICLPTSSAHQGRSYSGHVGTVAGWGSLRENGPQPSILQKVQIPIWANLDCARKYGRAAPGGIIESMVCAGQASKDSCSGDSGGPLIVNEGGSYIQVGIVSWGIGCGKGEYPGVYTRITSLLPWIYKNIK